MYYHEFSVGFNLWMLWIPVSIYGMFVLGHNKYRYDWRREERTLKIVKEYGNKLEYLVMGFATFVLALLLLVESAHGIVQFFDNRLVPGESPMWSIILSAFTIVAICFIYWIALCFVADYFAKKSKRRLRKNRRQREKELRLLHF